MNQLNTKKMLHEFSQQYIEDESTSLINHMERMRTDELTKRMVTSLILALKDKSALATELFEENDKLKELAK